MATDPPKRVAGSRLTIARLLALKAVVIGICGDCGRRAPVDLEALRAKHGDHFDVGGNRTAVGKALVCTDCGHTGGVIEFLHTQRHGSA